MMRFLFTPFIASLAALGSTAAQAQDSTENPFVGPYVGAQAGWGERSATLDFAIDGTDLLEKKRSGVDFGVYTGYNMSLGRGLVAGLEADLGIGGKKLSQDLAEDVSATIDPRFHGALTAKLGFVANNLMIYGLAGYGGERMKIDIDEDGELTSKKQWSDGLVYGGGVSMALSPNVSARVQYRHFAIDGGYSPDQVQVGASLRF